MHIDSFKVFNTSYEVHYFTGEVLEHQTKSETHVTGTGGGGSTHQGSGSTSSVSISSHTTVNLPFLVPRSAVQDNPDIRILS